MFQRFPEIPLKSPQKCIQGETNSIADWHLDLTESFDNLTLSFAIREHGLDEVGSFRIRFQNHDTTQFPSNARTFDYLALDKGKFGDFQFTAYNLTESEGSPNVTILFELSAKQPTSVSVDYEIIAITVFPPTDLNFAGVDSLVENFDLTFDDSGLVLSTSSLFNSDTYQPYDFNVEPDNLLNGTPVNAALLLSVFDGKDPNGTWKLHIVEAGLGDTAAAPVGGCILQGGYELIIEADAPPSIAITRVEHVDEPIPMMSVFYIGELGQIYRWQNSPDLTGGLWDTHADPFTASGAEEVLTVSTAGSEHLFVRIIEAP